MTASPDPAFAETFERLRLARGWKPAEVARRLGVYPTEVSRWRRGLGGISIRNVRKVAELFEVDSAPLERLAGFPESSTQTATPVSPTRQATHAQLDAWLNAVGEDYEEYFSASLKAHGDSARDLIELARMARTAVSTTGTAVVSHGVSAGTKKSKMPKKGGNSPLMRAQHPSGMLLASVEHRRGQTDRRIAA